MVALGYGTQGVDRSRNIQHWLNCPLIIFMQDDVAEVECLQDNGWTGTALLRWYHPDTMSIPPDQLAREIVTWMRNHSHVRISGIVPANELNADCEHANWSPFVASRMSATKPARHPGRWYAKNDGTDDLEYEEWPPVPSELVGVLGNGIGYWHSYAGYAEIDKWLSDFYDAFAILAPDLVDLLHWPALAPGGSPHSQSLDNTLYDPEYDLFPLSIPKYKHHDIHVYWDINDIWRGAGRLSRIAPALTMHGATDLHISETNRVDLKALMELARTFGIVSILWFLLDAQDENHREFDLIRGDYVNLDVMKLWMAEEEQGGGPVDDYVKEWLRDMWQRAGVANPDPDSVFQWAAEQAKSGKIFVPQPTANGDYQNWNHDKYVLCYMYPQPVYFEKDVWQIKEGFPPV